MFRIVQALNNNVALVRDEQGQQAVVMGLGIVFHKKKGGLIVPSKVEKIFSLRTEESKENFLTLLKIFHLISSMKMKTLQWFTNRKVWLFIHLSVTHQVLWLML